MITKVDNIQSVGIGFKYPTEFFGLSTDTKPTDTANGSVFTEIDSGKKYMFDFAGGQWYEIPAAESGGGSSGGVLVVHVDWDVGDGTLDKTWQEIHDAALEQVIILPGDDENTREVYYLQKVVGSHDLYAVDFAHNSSGGTDWMHFSASSASDYPVWYE